jgi:hypothetical protein
MTTPPYGLVPYDLTPPAMLIPGYHKRRGIQAREVELGSGDKATLEVTTWSGCVPECKSPRYKHEAGHKVVLSVPCDSLPHCNACECGSEHRIYLTDEQVAALKAALP